MLARFRPKLVFISIGCFITMLSTYSFLNPQLPIGKQNIGKADKTLTEFTESEMQESIRLNHLTPPSPLTLEYNLTYPHRTQKDWYTEVIFDTFGRNKRGVFLEAGAHDGEEQSNTLLLEKMGWKGILVECNPWSLERLRSKHRKAWIADVCLSAADKATTVKLYSTPQFLMNAQVGRPLNSKEMKMSRLPELANNSWVEFERSAFPVKTIIAAVGEFKEIDFLSLDVQGPEIEILERYPFDLYPVKLIIVEVFMFNEVQRQQLRKLLASKGYRFHSSLPIYGNQISDYAFVLNNTVSPSP